LIAHLSHSFVEQTSTSSTTIIITINHQHLHHQHHQRQHRILCQEVAFTKKRYLSPLHSFPSPETLRCFLGRAVSMDAMKEDSGVEGGLVEGGIAEDGSGKDVLAEGGLVEGGTGNGAVNDHHQFGMKWKGKGKARA